MICEPMFSRMFSVVRTGVRLLLSIALFTILTYLYVPSVDAAYLYFEPTASNVSQNETVVLNLHINTEGEQPTTTDAIVLFDPDKLQMIEVLEPAASEKFFPKFFLNTKTSKIFIGSAIQPQGTPQSGEGLIATLRFKAIADGTTTVRLECVDGKTTDSNITLKRNQRVTDIIDCSKVLDSTITIAGLGGGANPTLSPTGNVTVTVTQGAPTPSPIISASPTPTSIVTTTPSPSPTPGATLTPALSPTPTALPIPSVLPESGNLDTTSLMIATGVVLTLISIFIKLVL